MLIVCIALANLNPNLKISKIFSLLPQENCGILFYV